MALPFGTIESLNVTVVVYWQFRDNEGPSWSQENSPGSSSVNMFTIFIVDDDWSVLKALSRLLRAKAYEVCSYASPQAFLAAHDPAIPGCAVLDLSMPGLDGLELQQALRAGGSRRPVIFISGKGDIPTSVRAMRSGAIDFLTKPVSPKHLLEAIARAEEQDTKSRQIRAEVA